MRAVFGLVLILGVALAGGAVWMAKGYMDQQRLREAQAIQQLSAIVPTVEVYAVNTTVEYGDSLTPENIHVIRYPEEFLPEGVFRTEEEIFPEGVDVPRIVLRTMEPNEVVLAAKVTNPGEVAGLNQILRPGMRAFAISVDVTSGVSGFLRPGDNVDVYWTGSVGGSSINDREFTRLIQTSIRIIAVDQSANGSNTNARVARTITVEISPNQVASLAQAQATGRLTLSLVGLQDETVADAIEVDTNTLLGIEEVEEVIEVAPEPEEVCTLKNRRGAEVVDTGIVIPCPNAG